MTSKDRTSLLRVVDATMHESLLKILKALMARPKAKIFNQPVTDERLRYDEVIKETMDLGEVHRKLMDDKRRPYKASAPGELVKTYQVAEEFAHDVRLVFKNCFLFNTPDHHVFKDGLHLASNFEKALLDEIQAHEMRGPRCPMRTRCQLLGYCSVQAAP